MKKMWFVAALLVVTSLGAQEAKVLPLQEKDSRAAKEAWENLQHAQENWAHLQEVFRDKYTVVAEGDKDASIAIISTSRVGTTWAIVCADQILGGTYSKQELDKCHAEQAKERKASPPSLTYRRGWENGFKFSSDFKYIVPKPAPVYENPYGRLIINPAVTY